MSSDTITDNVAAHRYELEVDGHVAFAKYRLENKTLLIDYVEAPLPLRGTGAAGRLMQGIYDLAKQQGWEIVPICGYAASWLRRHVG